MVTNIDNTTAGFAIATAIGTIGAIATKGHRIINFINKLKFTTIDDIKSHLRLEHLDESTKFALEEELNRKAFDEATKINKNKETRDWVVEQIKSSNGYLTIEMFYHAQRFIKSDTKKISINLNNTSKHYYKFAIIIGFVILIYGATCLIYGANLLRSNALIGSLMIALFPVSIFFTISSFNDALSYESAKTIDGYLNKTEREKE